MNVNSRQHNCSDCPGRRNGVCGDLSDDELRPLAGSLSRKSWLRGTSVDANSESGGFFATVLSGIVKLTKDSADGRHQIVGLKGKGGLIGAMSGSDLSIAAVTNAEVCCVRFERFRSLTNAVPAVVTRMLYATLDELDRARDWMLLLGQKTAEERVAAFLLEASKLENSGASQCAGAAPAQLFLTRSEIASFLGLTSETVSRSLSRLQRQGIVTLHADRSVSVRNASRLASISDH